MPTRAQIVTEARTWLGTPFHHQGRVRGVGVDCIGVIGCSAVTCGVDGAAEWMSDPAMHNYSPQPDPRLLLAACDKYLDRIAVSEAGLADILIMAFAGEPMHFALISRVAPMYVIHAYAQIGKVTENGAKVAGATISRAYRFRGLNG
jgi:hypothetical protein